MPAMNCSAAILPRPRVRQSREQTDRTLVDSPWLLPGEFVVDKKGKVRLAYRYQFCEDWPDPPGLIAALKATNWDR